MAVITFHHKGNFQKTDNFLKKAKQGDYFRSLEKFAQEGVNALASATPIDSGKTAASWDYTISRSKGSVSITWTNSNINDGVNIAVIIQYGHGTRNGGYVQGRDYINPAIQPIFDKIAEQAWKGVTKL